MSWLHIIQVLWPIAVIVTPLVTGAGFIWLKTQFPTKSELKSIEQRLEAIEAANRDRFERGSRKFADHDKRIAIIEEDCKEAPTRNDLNQAITTLAGRMSGVESSVRGMEKTMSTQHDYLRTVIEKALDA